MSNYIIGQEVMLRCTGKLSYITQVFDDNTFMAVAKDGSTTNDAHSWTCVKELIHEEATEVNEE